MSAHLLAGLVRRHALWRGPWRWLPLFLILVQLPLLTLGAASPDSLPLFALLALWLPLAVHQFIAGFLPRCSRLDPALPVSGPALWTAHLLTWWLQGLMLLALLALVDLLAWRVLAAAPDTAPHAPALLSRLVRVATVFTLTAAFMNARRLGHISAGPSLTQTSLGLAVLAGGTGLVVWMAHGPVWLAPASLLIAVIAAVWLAARVPPSLQEPSSLERPAQRAAPALLAAGGRTLRLQAIWLSLFGPSLPWVLLPLTVFYGGLTSGCFQILAGEPGAVLELSFMAAYMIAMAAAVPLRRLAVLDALPISRRALFAVAALPCLLAYVASYGLGRTILALNPEKAPAAGNLPPVAAVLALVCVSALLVLALMLRVARADAHGAGRRSAMWLGLGLLVGAQLLLLGGALARWWEIAALWRAIAGVAQTVPGGPLATWGIGLVATAAAYRLAEAQFEALEAGALPESELKWWQPLAS